MTDLTNVQCNHKFLTTLSLTIHIQNISTIDLFVPTCSVLVPTTKSQQRNVE
jgi:hypothetical protein